MMGVDEGNVQVIDFEMIMENCLITIPTLSGTSGFNVIIFGESRSIVVVVVAYLG